MILLRMLKIVIGSHPAVGHLRLLIPLHHLTAIRVLHADVRHVGVADGLALPLLLLLLLKSLVALDLVFDDLLQVFEATVLEVTSHCDFVRQELGLMFLVHLFYACLLLLAKQLLLKLSELQILSNAIELGWVEQPKDFPSFEDLYQLGHPAHALGGAVCLVFTLVLDDKVHDNANLPSKDEQVVSLHMLANRVHHQNVHQLVVRVLGLKEVHQQ